MAKIFVYETKQTYNQIQLRFEQKIDRMNAQVVPSSVALTDNGRE